MPIKEWNPTKDDELKVDRLINGHQLDYDDLVLQKKSKEYELSKIKQDLRIGGYKNDAVYQALCRNQKALITELGELQPEINKVKKQLRDKRLMKEEIRNHIYGSMSISDEVEKKIYELRDNYSSFASDATRISSTRIMASKFVEEIQVIINILEKT